jgi:hypothetical protein
VLRLLVLDTLRPEEDSFVSDQLKEAFSDLVFSVRTLAGQYVNICFLIEHKSTPDKAAVFQILHYISSVRACSGFILRAQTATFSLILRCKNGLRSAATFPFSRLV